ncbi:MAG: hypothetical protein LKH33_00640 [Acetobacter sp.]|nr:hypothetical protein [Acetobacter sp.]MCH4062441.1 hypothetical protein [Acetobacter sp.]MCH4088712.1 hypothetical protein [Acetobacter sp.]MCI1292617.1 hypothetical protein [Acetobacter sp.]MCI1319283.1 hypothetical protein [Acetobacter sp.]
MSVRTLCLFVLLLLPVACSPGQVASYVTGRECSSAVIAEGQGYCRSPELPPPPQPYCTQGWSGVDCWSRPDLMPNVARQVYEGPTGLTQQQNANRLNMSDKAAPPSSQY